MAGSWRMHVIRADETSGAFPFLGLTSTSSHGPAAACAGRLCFGDGLRLLLCLDTAVARAWSLQVIEVAAAEPAAGSAWFGGFLSCLAALP